MWIIYIVDFKLSPFNAAYMRQLIGLKLVQTKACRLFGAKPLSEPMLGYCQLDPKVQTSVEFWPKYKNCHLKLSSAKWRLFVQGRWVNESYMPQTSTGIFLILWFTSGLLKQRMRRVAVKKHHEPFPTNVTNYSLYHVLPILEISRKYPNPIFRNLANRNGPTPTPLPNR